VGGYRTTGQPSDNNFTLLAGLQTSTSVVLRDKLSGKNSQPARSVSGYKMVLVMLEFVTRLTRGRPLWAVAGPRVSRATVVSLCLPAFKLQPPSYRKTNPPTKTRSPRQASQDIFQKLITNMHCASRDSRARDQGFPVGPSSKNQKLRLKTFCYQGNNSSLRDGKTNQAKLLIKTFEHDEHTLRNIAHNSLVGRTQTVKCQNIYKKTSLRKTVSGLTQLVAVFICQTG